jgi:hypothetical protein
MGKALCLLAFAAGMEAGQATGKQDSAARHGDVHLIQAVRSGEPIRVDGHLDDAAWQRAEAASAFRQVDPKEGEPATERTEMRVAFDDEALYVGFRLFDGEPKRIVRRLSRRDDDSDADYVKLYLDPRLDHQTGAIFLVTAAGVQADAVLFNDSWDDSSWDAVWESAVSIDEQGWSAELRIPFSQLRFSSGNAQTWGINAARFIQRKNETDWLELVPKKESGIASRMAHVAGLDGLRPRRALSLLPYTVARSEHVSADSGNPFNDGSRQFGGFGADLKYGITTNLTLDATINPDFGQVEVDPAVVNLSQFETFFEERRPFFIEGSQIFSNFGRNGANNFWGFNRSEPNLFYSRRIGRSPQGDAEADFVDRSSATTILGAGKVSGKTASGWSLGLLEAVTGKEYARTFSGTRDGRVLVEPLTNYVVARAHRDFGGGRAGLGVLATSVIRSEGTPELREELTQRAHVFGVDGYRFFDAKKDWVVTGRLAFSRLDGSVGAIRGIQESAQHNFQRPDSDRPRLDGRGSMDGWTGSLNLNRNSGNFQLNAALWATSPGFESNDLGFNFQSDRWGGHIVGSVRKTDPDRWTRRRFLSVAKSYALNFDGDRQHDGVFVFFNGQMTNYWNFGANTFQFFGVQRDNLTRGGPSAANPKSRAHGLWLGTDDRKRVVAALEFFREGASQTGSFTGYWLNLRFKPSSGVSVQLGPNLRMPRPAAQWVDGFDDPTAAVTFGRRYVFAALRQNELAMTTRVNWILSPRMSLQIYAQPLISSGDYQGFKEFVTPRRFDFARYGADRGEIVFDREANEYRVDPDGPGPAPAFTFGNPDFNFKSLRLNAVFRWEWRLGSTLYVVWTQNRSNDVNPGTFEFRRDVSDLFGANPDDVFLVKFSYRLGR